MGRCGGIGEDVWPYHRSGCYSCQRRGAVYSACYLHRSYWRYSLPSSIRPCPYILTACCGIASHWGGSSEDHGCNFLPGENHRWHESLAISSGEDQSITPEGGSLSYLGFPNTFPREELVCTDDSEPWSIWIKANLITIPNLGWTRLDFFEVFGYCFLVKIHCWLLYWDLGCFRWQRWCMVWSKASMADFS